MFKLETHFYTIILELNILLKPMFNLLFTFKYMVQTNGDILK